MSVLQPRGYQCDPLGMISIGSAAWRDGPRGPGSLLLEGQLSQGAGKKFVTICRLCFG